MYDAHGIENLGRFRTFQQISLRARLYGLEDALVRVECGEDEDAGGLVERADAAGRRPAVPPIRWARSRMPIRPKPPDVPRAVRCVATTSGSKPTPSSWIVRTALLSSTPSVISTCVARACLAIFASASCPMR